jgi:hypothetical protein
MALVKTTLEAAIKTAFQTQSTKTDNPDGALSNLASQLATAIDSYLRSATVTTLVTGSCATPSGAGTIAGNGTGSLS